MDQLQKAGGPATSVGIDQNRARVRLFLMTPNVSCRSAVKATAVARSMIKAIRGGRPSPPESMRILVQITDAGCFNRLRARPPLARNQHQMTAFGAKRSALRWTQRSAFLPVILKAARPSTAPFRSFTTREFLTTCGYIGDISKPV